MADESQAEIPAEPSAAAHEAPPNPEEAHAAAGEAPPPPTEGEPAAEPAQPVLSSHRVTVVRSSTTGAEQNMPTFRQSMLEKPDLTGLLSAIQSLNEEDTQALKEKLLSLGLELPLDEGGNQNITFATLEQNVVVVSNAYQHLIAMREKEKQDREHEKEKEMEKRISLDKNSDRKSKSDSGEGGSDIDLNEELELTVDQKIEFYQKATNQGYTIPRDNLGRPKFTRGLLDRLPDDLANEIMDAVDANMEGSEYSSSEESDARHRGSQRSGSNDQEIEQTILGLRLSKGINYLANDQGDKLTFEEIAYLLRKAFSDHELQIQEEASKARDAALRALIREERRHEEKETNFRKVESLVKMQEMTMRYVPGFNMTPLENDPIELLDKNVVSKGAGAVRIAETPKGTDLIHLLAPKEFAVRQMDSFATLTSTIDRKISVATMRGSMISTHLSDMPSTFSQALLDEPSEVVMAPSEQAFDITEESAHKFMEKWLTDYMSGFVPRNTFTVRIINMISQKEVELRVLRHYTLNEVCHMYMQYEDHPEYYLWKDIYGRVLVPTKNLVENALVGTDEVLEFQGYRKLPVILLYFRDGFENEQPLPLNPLHALRHREPGLCRNY